MLLGDSNLMIDPEHADVRQGRAVQEVAKIRHGGSTRQQSGVLLPNSLGVAREQCVEQAGPLLGPVARAALRYGAVARVALAQPILELAALNAVGAADHQRLQLSRPNAAVERLIVTTNGRGSLLQRQ